MEAGAQCPICLEALEERHPLRLPCNAIHVFCKECIEPWARQHRRCMYMCEIRPWDLAPWTEIDHALIDKTRIELAATGLYAFGTSPETRVDFFAGPTQLQTFGQQSNVPRDGNWAIYLAGRDQPDKDGVSVGRLAADRMVTMKGVGLLESERLLIPVINLANAIPILAANHGRAYSWENMLLWRLVVEGLLTQIHTTPTKVERQIETVPERLRERVIVDCAETVGNVDNNPFLQSGLYGSDFTLLLEYVAFLMWRERWTVPNHTPAGFLALKAFREQRRLEFRQFEQATWKLEDSQRHCFVM